MCNHNIELEFKEAVKDRYVSIIRKCTKCDYRSITLKAYATVKQQPNKKAGVKQ